MPMTYVMRGKPKHQPVLVLPRYRTSYPTYEQKARNTAASKATTGMTCHTRGTRYRYRQHHRLCHTSYNASGT